MAVIIRNSIFGFLQEYRAERAVAALKRLLPFQATVLLQATVLRRGVRGASPHRTARQGRCSAAERGRPRLGGCALGVVYAKGTPGELLAHCSYVLVDGLLSNRFPLWGFAFELVFAAGLIYLPFLQRLFGTARVRVDWWLFLLACIPLIFLLEEARKALIRRKG